METKICVQCGEAKPYDDYGPNEKKPAGYFAKCYACRIANGSGKSHRWGAERGGGEAQLEVAEPATCAHRRLCGDSLILQAFPDFYETHERPGNADGREWQVCTICGDAKLVRLYDSIESLAVEPPSLSRYVSERASAVYARDSVTIKPKEAQQEITPMETNTERSAQNGHVAAVVSQDRSHEPCRAEIEVLEQRIRDLERQLSVANMRLERADLERQASELATRIAAIDDRLGTLA